MRTANQSGEYLDRAGTGDPATSQPVAGAKRVLRILIVDDFRDAAESLARLLRLMGHEVSTTHDGPAAVAAAIAFKPDLAFIDLALPGMTGYDLARRLRTLPETMEAYLAAHSGHGQQAERERAIAAGCDCHLLKPISMPQLQSVLAEVTGRQPR